MYNARGPILDPNLLGRVCCLSGQFSERMSPDEPNTPRETAIEQLEWFGFSSYAAETFVTLLGMDGATARQISENSAVPRTRVYDAVDELNGRGLVDVQHSNPKRFRAVSRETTGQRFEQRFTERLNRFRTALEALDTDRAPDEQRGVWTVTGRETVTERVVEFIDAAEEEIVFVSVAELLTDEVVERLTAARERGVSIRLGEMADSSERQINGLVPGTEFIPSLWNWEETPSGRLLMVDGKQTLVSVLVPGAERTKDETAIWGAGERNSLVVVLRALFTWQLDSSSFE